MCSVYVLMCFIWPILHFKISKKLGYHRARK
jgi:hypothetical protein